MKLDKKDLLKLGITLAIVVAGVAVAQLWVIPMFNKTTIPPASA